MARYTRRKKTAPKKKKRTTRRSTKQGTNAGVYTTTLVDTANLASFTGTSSQAFRNYNLFLNQITKATRWDGFANLFQEFKVLKAWTEVHLKTVEQISHDGSLIAGEQFAPVGINVGLYIDATAQIADATICGAATFEHPNCKHTWLEPGRTVTVSHPFIVGTYYQGGTTALEIPDMSYKATRWYTTQTDSNRNSIVKARMGQFVISNPGIQGAEMSDYNGLVELKTYFKVQFRGVKFS